MKAAPEPIDLDDVAGFDSLESHNAKRKGVQGSLFGHNPRVLPWGE
jgi:hypothetical protein